MRRRIVLVVSIVAVASVLALAIFWYVRRSSTGMLYERAELAMDAQKYDKALELSDQYAQKSGDWRGYWLMGRAHLAMDQFAQARPPLEIARQKSDDERIVIAQADSYILPARRSLQGRTDLAAFETALAGLQKAQDLMHAAKEPHAVALREHEGLNRLTLGWAWRNKAATLQKLAELASTAASHKEHQTLLARAKQARDNSATHDDAATKLLLDVLREDPSRSQAATSLVDLCISHQDKAAIAQARELILKQPTPPPLAAARLLAEDLPLNQQPLSRAQHSRLRKGIQEIELVTAKSSGTKISWEDQIRIQIFLADLHLSCGQDSQAQAICDELLRKDSELARARFLHAKLLIRKGRLQDAEGELYDLQSRFRTWTEVQYAYGLLAARLKKYNVAEQAMRQVVTAQEDHFGARQFLVEEILREGEAKDAYLDARELYRAHGDSPRALNLLVQVCVQMRRPELAVEPLSAAVKTHGDKPAVMMAAADGYAALLRARYSVDKTLPTAIAAKVATAKPASVEDAFAIARALRNLGKIAPAEQMLTQLAIDYSDYAPAHFQLAEFYAQTGRSLQSIEQYRKAVELDKDNPAYHYALARALLDSGNVEESQAHLEQLERTPSVSAKLLSAQVQLMRGGSASSESLLKDLPKGPMSAFWLAYAAMMANQPQKCLDITLKALATAADDADLLLLSGQAYRELGDNARCIKQWTRLLQVQNDRLVNYTRLGRVLLEQLRHSREDAQASHLSGPMSTLVNVKTDLLALAVGRLSEEEGNLPAAVAQYRALVDDKQAPAATRQQAQLRLCVCLAHLGHSDQAMEGFTQLAKEPAYRQRALLGQAQLHIQQRQVEEAMAPLAELSTLALAGRQYELLQRLAINYVRIDRKALAMDLCDRAMAADPKEPQPYLLKAVVLDELGQPAESARLFAKATAMQPGNFTVRITHARMHDRHGQPAEALKVLDELAACGQAARIAALSERARMLTTWGLTAEAGRCYRQMENDLGKSPAMQLELASLYAQLQLDDDARRVLATIPSWAPQYAQGQQMRAMLAKSPQEQLQALRKLRTSQPHSTSLLAQEMEVLMRLKRADDALKAYDAFVQSHQDQPRPPMAASLALRAMLGKEQFSAAADLAATMSAQTRSANWRRTSILLTMDRSDDDARKLLGAPERADAFDALLGLTLAGDATQLATWRARLRELDAQDQTLSPMVAVMIALLQQNTPAAREALDKLPKDTLLQAALSELIAAHSATNAPPAETRQLLRASLAIDLELNELGRKWAMTALAGRPACQWAASLILRSGPDSKTLAQIADTLRPSDGPLALSLKGMALAAQGQDAQAADAFAVACRAGGNTTELLMQQAVACERAGKTPEALGLYRQVLQRTGDPMAANNAAYLQCQLHPGDDKALADAQQWIQKALADTPNRSDLLDTSGWIAYHQDRFDDACRQLLAAVKGIDFDRSLEVHYHLGLAYKAANNKPLAAMHLGETLRRIKMMQATGQPLPASVKDLARQAQEAMVASRDK